MKRRVLSVLLMVAMVLTTFSMTALPSSAATNPYRCGDVNGDGLVTIVDALEVLKYLAGIDNVMTSANRQVINPAAFLAARGVLSKNDSPPAIRDVLEILKLLAGIQSTLTGKTGYCDYCRANQGVTAPSTTTGSGNTGTTATTVTTRTTVTTPVTTPGTTIPLPNEVRPPDLLPAKPFAQVTAQDVVDSMRMGWNLGNTFDYHNGFGGTGTTIEQFELGWLQNNINNLTTRALFQEVRRQGFDVIRIPVTWYKASDRNNNWNIRADYMARVKAVVDMAIAEDFFVILNTHHEELSPNAHQPATTTFNRGGFSLYDRHLAQSQVFVRRMWEQIAGTFNNDYSHKLIFEILNEPRGVGSPQEWGGGTEEEQANLNILNQVAVDAIRATGGRNTHRILMFPTYAASPLRAAIRAVDVPKDPLNPGVNKMILSIHAYHPERFCFRANRTTNSTAVFESSFENIITNTINQVATEAATKGVPVIMGEWGSVNKGNTAARAAHAQFYANAARSRGIVPVWWDNGSAALGLSGNTDGFGLIRRDVPHSTVWNLRDEQGRDVSYDMQPILSGIRIGSGGYRPRVTVNFPEEGSTTTAATTASSPPTVINTTTTTTGVTTTPLQTTTTTPTAIVTTPTAIVTTTPIVTTTTPVVTTTTPIVTTPTAIVTTTTPIVTTTTPIVTTTTTPIVTTTTPVATTTTTTTTAAVVNGVLFNMQTADNLDRMASGGGNIPMLQGAGGGSSQRTVQMGPPRSITIANRAGAPASGVDIRLANLATRAGYSYRFEVTGRLGSSAGAEMRFMLAEAPMTELINPRPATTSNGAFTMTYIATHEEIRAWLAANPEQRIRIRSHESTDDLVITGIIITEVLTSTVTTAATTTPSTPATTPTTTTTTTSGGNNSNFQNMSAHQVVQNMGVGWNLGNTFDAYADDTNNGVFSRLGTMNANNIIQIETEWIGGTSNQTTQAFINSVKAAGFDTIRIPVTWWKATNANRNNLAGNSYQINPDWMARIKRVVDWAIAADMYVILNTHHEETVMPMDSGGRANAVRFVRIVWEQIAQEFRNYDHRLIFEGLNEPRDRNDSNQWWGGNATGRESLNQMNAAFVNAVRTNGSTGSNNNRWRILMVPTYAAGAQQGSPVFDGFVIPADTVSGSVNKMILSVHTYSPFAWAHDGGGNYGSGGQDLARIRSDLDFVRTHARRLGTPVVLGEWGSTAASQLSQRVTHAEDYVRESRARGMATVWWDNNGTSTSGHGFGLLNRANPGSYRFPTIVEAIMRGGRAPFTPQT